MTPLQIWARKWSIPHAALADFPNPMIAHTVKTTAVNETQVLDRVRLLSAQHGWRLMRNNVGATRTDDGRFLRYGLCNDSKALNASIKSSDLIGLRPVLIGPEHLGRTLGQFVAIECKRPGWTLGAAPREVAQAAFLDIIRSLGGHAIFSTGGVE